MRCILYISLGLSHRDWVANFPVRSHRSWRLRCAKDGVRGVWSAEHCWRSPRKNKKIYPLASRAELRGVRKAAKFDHYPATMTNSSLIRLVAVHSVYKSVRVSWDTRTCQCKVVQPVLQPLQVAISRPVDSVWQLTNLVSYYLDWQTDSFWDNSNAWHAFAPRSFHYLCPRRLCQLTKTRSQIQSLVRNWQGGPTWQDRVVALGIGPMLPAHFMECFDWKRSTRSVA